MFNLSQFTNATMTNYSLEPVFIFYYILFIITFLICIISCIIYNFLSQNNKSVKYEKNTHLGKAKAKQLVKNLNESDIEALLEECCNRILIPNWWTKTDLEYLSDTLISEDEWKQFFLCDAINKLHYDIHYVCLQKFNTECNVNGVTFKNNKETVTQKLTDNKDKNLQKAIQLVRDLDESDLEDFLEECANRILIPIWYTKTDIENISSIFISDNEWNQIISNDELINELIDVTNDLCLEWIKSTYCVKTNDSNKQDNNLTNLQQTKQLNKDFTFQELLEECINRISISNEEILTVEIIDKMIDLTNKVYLKWIKSDNYKEQKNLEVPKNPTILVQDYDFDKNDDYIQFGRFRKSTKLNNEMTETK